MNALLKILLTLFFLIFTTLQYTFGIPLIKNNSQALKTKGLIDNNNNNFTRIQTKVKAKKLKPSEKQIMFYDKKQLKSNYLHFTNLDNANDMNTSFTSIFDDKDDTKVYKLYPDKQRNFIDEYSKTLKDDERKIKLKTFFNPKKVNQDKLLPSKIEKKREINYKNLYNCFCNVENKCFCYLKKETNTTRNTPLSK